MCNRLKVVHVIYGMNTGGRERLMLDMLPVLAEYVDVRLYVLANTGVLMDECRQLALPVTVDPHERAGLSIAGIARFRRYLRSERPDIVNFHLPESCVWVLTALSCPGQHVALRFADVSDHRTLLNLHRHRAVARRCHLLYANSVATRQHYERRYELEPERVAVVHNGVKVDDIRTTAPSARPQSRQRIVSAARLTHRKGVDVLIEAAALLQDLDVELVILGEGPLGTELRQLATGTGIARRTRFEVLPQREWWGLARSCDVYVQPSRYEAFGIAAVEAMAAAAPVVASSIGGLRETVVDGVTGLLVPPDDPRALAAAMRQVLTDPSAAQAMGAAAQARAAEHFSIGAMARQLADLYSHHISSSRRP